MVLLGCLAVGGVIYLFLRAPVTLYFRAVDLLGLTSPVFAARRILEPVAAFTPRWVLFSLPDALWAYAGSASMLLLWRDEGETGSKLFWMSLFPVLSLGSEVAQLFHVLPGHFDPMDLTLSALGILLAYRSQVQAIPRNSGAHP